MLMTKELEKIIPAMYSSENTKLEDKMIEIVKNHYMDTFTSLKTIPGIGPKTAIILIVITNNFKKFDDP